MKMKYHILLQLCTFTSLLTLTASAQKRFGGALQFKGGIEDGQFEGPSFRIVAEDDKFVLTVDKTMFSFPFKRQGIFDAVVSQNKNAAAVDFNGQSWDNPLRTLATVDREGRLRLVEYKRGEFTEDYGWVVELGAVSGDGQNVLVRCARFLPSENGFSWVRHKWVIVELGDDSVKVVESESAVDKWHHFSGHDQKRKKDGE